MSHKNLPQTAHFYVLTTIMTVLSSTTKHKKNEYVVRMPHKQFRKKAATIFIKIAAALRAESGTRTRDLFITNELLYQLSHFGLVMFWASCRIRTNDPEITNHVLWPTELKRRVGKLTASRRYNQLPLLRSSPGGFEGSWPCSTYP